MSEQTWLLHVIATIKLLNQCQHKSWLKQQRLQATQQAAAGTAAPHVQQPFATQSPRCPLQCCCLPKHDTSMLQCSGACTSLGRKLMLLQYSQTGTWPRARNPSQPVQLVATPRQGRPWPRCMLTLRHHRALCCVDLHSFNHTQYLRVLFQQSRDSAQRVHHQQTCTTCPTPSGRPHSLLHQPSHSSTHHYCHAPHSTHAL